MKVLGCVPFILEFCNRKQKKKNKMDIDQLLESKDINNFIIELDNYISELCDNGENMDRLTEAQKVFYYNQNIENEVNDGGFNQYFFNSSGNNALEIVESLKIIGAYKTASIVQRAVNQFPNSKIPKDRAERIALLQQIESIANHKWEELEQEFYKYEDDLNKLNIEFIKKNKKDF